MTITVVDCHLMNHTCVKFSAPSPADLNFRPTSSTMFSLAVLIGSLATSVSATSHVMVSLGGSHYEHGSKGPMAQPSSQSHMLMKDSMDMMDPPMAVMDSMDKPMEPMTMDVLPMEPLPQQRMANQGPPLLPHLFHGGAQHLPSRRVLAAPVVHPHHHASVVLPTAQHAPLLHSQVMHGVHQSPILLASGHQTTHLPVLHQTHHHQLAPTHNCTVERVMERSEVCTPTLATSCVTMDLPVKKVMEKEQCEEVVRTVCSEEKDVIENEVCFYEYRLTALEAEASTVSVTFKQECMDQMVTVCQGGPGQGYHSYGHVYCKEVSQKTCYNSPMVMPKVDKVMLSFPEAMRKCESRPIILPRVSCQMLAEKKCIMVPEVVEEMDTVEKCEVVQGEPNCQMVEMDLPRQICSEIIYGAMSP